MPTSYNGWPASPTLPLRALEVAGESFVPGILDNDDVYTVLQFVAEQMHERVERVWAPGWHEMDDWGFNYRPTTNDDSLSCHASGTAIDYNSTRHPYGVPTLRNFTVGQVEEIRKIVREAGVIRWGGEWNTPDAMHFEIMGTRAEVAAAAARIREMREDEMKPEDFERIKEIVQNNSVTAAAVREIVREEIDAQFNEQVTVKKADGTTRLITFTNLFREVWQKLNKTT